MVQGGDILKTFISEWKKSFRPEIEKKWRVSENGLTQREKGWLISREWSFYLMRWLKEHFGKVIFEVGCDRELGCGKGRRLDAALWLKKPEGSPPYKEADLAIEWEWDNNRVYKEFPEGDFMKVLRVPAKAGLAIVHTRAGQREDKAGSTINKIKHAYKSYRKKDRPVGVLEIRRVVSNNSEVEFKSLYHNLINDDSIEFTPLVFKNEFDTYRK